MRFTIRLKIIATMGLALLAAVVVGLVGLYGVRSTYALVDDMYRNNVQAMAAVSQARAAIIEDRLALNRSIIDPSRHDAVKRINAGHEALINAWKRYYPGMVSATDERAVAARFDELIKTSAPDVSHEAELLDAGKNDEGRKFHIATVADEMGKATDAIDQLMVINEKQAAQSAQDAAASFHHTWQLALVVLLIAIAGLIVVAMALIRAVTRPLNQARELAGAIQQGKLNNATIVTGNDEFSDTLRSLDEMDRHLAGIVTQVRDVAEQVTSAARDLSQGNDDLSQRTQEQASSLEETAASMEELSSTVKQNAEGAGQAREMALRMRKRAEEGRDIAGSAVGAMEAITQASKEVGEIVVMIDEIAFQTNLLALNAGVEAARAGDAGKGFAVVASEVRALAQRSAEAAKDVKDRITASSQQVEAGVEMVGETGKALERIISRITGISGLVEGIALGADQQSAGLSQVNTAVAEMDGVTQQNAAMVEQATAAARSLAGEADELARQVSQFKLDRDGRGAPAAASKPSKRDAGTARRGPALRTVGNAALAAEADDWSEF